MKDFATALAEQRARRAAWIRSIAADHVANGYSPEEAEEMAEREWDGPEGFELSDAREEAEMRKC